MLVGKILAATSVVSQCQTYTAFLVLDIFHPYLHFLIPTMLPSLLFHVSTNI